MTMSTTAKESRQQLTLKDVNNLVPKNFSMKHNLIVSTLTIHLRSKQKLILCLADSIASAPTYVSCRDLVRGARVQMRIESMKVLINESRYSSGLARY